MVSQAQKSGWIRYEGSDGIGRGRHIVFISGDEEYRSEEALPMLAKILSQRFGFKCTILFAIDPQTGTIDPNNQTNLPGFENLETADLVFMFIRFRELPDKDMQFFDNYVRSGKPIVALRTSTHAFNYTRRKESQFAKYDFQSKVKGWEDGFGRKILGETWVDHHGDHGEEGTRAFINGIKQNEKHPVLNGVKDIWCPTDVYAVRELPDNSEVLVYGAPTSGMTSSAPVNTAKSIMPVAWTRTYSSETGKQGRIFTSTMGAAIDLVSEDLRRLLVNASLWALGLEEKIPQKADVIYIGEYTQTMFGHDLFAKKRLPSFYEEGK
jgi:type 1 glutamine amidotransferase